MHEDNSLEFDMFEEVRQRLTEMLVREGRELIEAERIALYVVQGVREVPKMLTMIVKSNQSDVQVRAALLSMLNNASALDKAKNLILGLDEKIIH
jgi:hypothetical protein